MDLLSIDEGGNAGPSSRLVRLTDTLVHLTDTPVQSTDTLVQSTDTPVQSTDTLVRLTDTPVRLTDTPVRLTDTPVQSTDTLVRLTDTPVQLTDTLVQLLDREVQLLDRASCLLQRASRCLYRASRCLYRASRCLYRASRCLYRPSRCLHRSSCRLHRPSRCLHRSSCLLYRPSRYLHRPSRCLHRSSCLLYRPSRYLHRSSRCLHRVSSCCTARPVCCTARPVCCTARPVCCTAHPAYRAPRRSSARGPEQHHQPGLGSAHPRSARGSARARRPGSPRRRRWLTLTRLSAGSMASPSGMDLAPLHGGRLIYAGQLLALAMTYVVLGRLGLMMNPVSGFATLAWPPSGISLAALLLGGYRLWPGIALGALATNLWMGAPPLVACGIALGNTLEAVAGTFALRGIPGFRSSLDRFMDVVGLVGLAGMMSAALSATIGVVSLLLAGIVSKATFARTWLAWWTGDVISVLIITPVVLSCLRGSRVAMRPAALAEAAASGALLIVCAGLVFGQRPEAAAQILTFRPHVVFLPLIWAALSFHIRGAALGAFVVAVAAVWGTYTGHGVFARADRTEGLIALQAFLGLTSVVSLILGAVVSERERSRKELAESEARLRAILDGTTDAIYVKDRLGRYLIVNATCARLIGMPPEAFIGKDDEALLPADEARQLREVDQEVMRTGEPRTLEESLTLRDGHRIYLATKAPYRDRAGNVQGVIGISRDITERKRIEAELRASEERKRFEEELRESEERQRLAVEAAHLGMWFWDMKNDRLIWTSLCRSMHGIGPDEEVSYERFLAILHPDDREPTERKVERTLEERTEYRNEYRALWPDGSVHWISALGCVYYNERAEPLRMLGVAIDITARRQAEQERAEMLEREQAARAEAQAATRAKDEFLAVLSHELRTPLQAIIGWTQLLRAQRLDERAVQKGLATIDRNVKVQAQLIEDLLDVSRIVSGKLRLEQRTVDLEHVVLAALESAKISADAKSIQLDVTKEPLSGDVLGDPDRLQQVVSNLLSNAVKFTPSRGRIRVRLGREGAATRIDVEDTGRGIPPELLPRVFDRFWQAESTTKRSYGGLGLGLAIVRRLVELHGGTVKAESRGEGQGATFTVTLPLQSAEHRAITDERSPPARSGSPVPLVLDGVRVLVVDDDVDARELLETVLHEAGADARTVSSARGALDALGSFCPHLLMSDIGMPEEDGYALIREVRARESAGGGHVPAVALTAFASQADRETALSLGFDAHIAKPASPGDLASTVARLLGRDGRLKPP